MLEMCAYYQLVQCILFTIFYSINHVIIVYIDNIDNENINFEKGHVGYFN